MMLRMRQRNSSRYIALRPRAGMSIVEVVVAMLLFGTVAVSMGGLSLVVARRGEANDVFAKRSAVLQQQMNRLQALPYDSLVTKVGSLSVTDASFPHTRVISMANQGARTRVTIRIVPTKAPSSAETISFDRARPTSSPLCTGC
jgi:hypothetical protein